MEHEEGISVSEVEQKFSVLNLSLRTKGVQQYLGIDLKAPPEQAKTPVAEDRLPHLANLARWMFGTKQLDPLFTDSRNVDKFGRVLQSAEAVKYLESTERPVFTMATRKAGADDEEVVSYLEIAGDNIELSLSLIHLFEGQQLIKKPLERLLKGADALRRFA